MEEKLSCHTSILTACAPTATSDALQAEALDIEDLRDHLRGAVLQLLQKQDDLFAAFSTKSNWGAVKDVSGSTPRSPTEMSRMGLSTNHKSMVAAKYDVDQEPAMKCAGLRRNLTRLKTSDKASDFVRSQHLGGAKEDFWSAPVIGALQWWENLTEPTRTGVLARLVSSKRFEALVILAIVCNGLLTIYTTNYDMRLENSSSGSETGADHDTFFFLDLFFLTFFLVELLLRLWAHKLYFFCNDEWSWAVFDSGILLSSCTEACIQAFVRSDGSTHLSNLTFLRTLRLMKLGKLLRTLRAVWLINDLRKMLLSIWSCIRDFSLGWCLILICLVNGVFALVFVQSMTQFLAQNRDGLTQELRDEIELYFGSVEVAMLSLFQATTGGEDWRTFYRIVAHAGALASGLFLFYIAFFVLAAMNIVTSTFVEKTLKIVEADADNLLLEKRHADHADANELWKLMDKLRESHDAYMTLPEFLELTENEQFLDFFSFRGLDIKDAYTFFKMLASFDGNNDVDLDTFVCGCTRMKGTATTVDLHTLSFETRVLLTKQFQSMKRLEDYVKGLIGGNGTAVSIAATDAYATTLPTTSL
eukprot:TRINITY_DN11686_c0_g1_i14.p1 TRINITY_DN11686_c0_g1~~TRINITY_DN11686_c0_g1_i14.p1  ORF type:complete len:631 (+),score=95.74 TRINITY_DN11686_c0_g1_i14:134-1894(+)